MLDKKPELELMLTYEEVQKARFDPLLIDFLKSYYPYPLLYRGGTRYPVFVVPTSESQSCDFESILGTLHLGEHDLTSNADRNDQYRNMLTQLGKNVYNGRLYVMDKANISGRLQLDCSLGGYYDALATCDALEWELLEALANVDRGNGVAERLRDRLTMRNRANLINPEPCTVGFGRCAALSIATLIVCTDAAMERALIRYRSGLTAAHSNLYHVVPSFMMENSQAQDPRDEYCIFHQVLREYLEEVFGLSEGIKSTEQCSHRWFYEHPHAIRLRQMLASGRAQLFLTGYAVNLLNLRPEICTLLLIRDSGWLLSSDIRANWEFLSPTEDLNHHSSDFLTFSVLHSDDVIGDELRRLPGTFVPPGAAAFWLGVDTVRRVLGRSDEQGDSSNKG